MLVVEAAADGVTFHNLDAHDVEVNKCLTLNRNAALER